MMVVCGWLGAVALSIAAVCYEFDSLLSVLHR